MRALIGFDGGDGGRDALELARILASATAADVVVVTVVPYGPLPVSSDLLDEDALTGTGPGFAEARERLTGLDVETRTYGGGSPAGVLTELAEGEDFDLIVIGSPRHGPLGRALIGSTGDSLLPGAPCAVAVAPRGYAAASHDRFRQIAVAYDGTPEAKAALRQAGSIARAMSAEIRVMSVVAPPIVHPEMRGYAPPRPPHPEEIVEEAMRSIDPHLSARSELLEGPPARRLAEACADGVDLIVAGSRGHGPLKRVLLGSVSRSLVHQAPCPVIVVPRP